LDGLALTGLLLGLVFAALSLLIAHFSNEYMRILNQPQEGVAVFLRPCMIAMVIPCSPVSRGDNAGMDFD
jgi:hypothetical protein